VFKPALLANAGALVLSHNHPSGDPTPSANDFDMTAKLVAAGTLLGIQILDHIIVGDRRYVSFKEIGRM
jgi:DNA repair protein RadC